MREHAVNWTEGMFLCPQHFQAADRYWRHHAAVTERLSRGYGYGIGRLEYSAEALTNSQLQITVCEARFRDGTVAQIGPDELRVDLNADRTTGRSLSDLLDEQEAVMVLLAVAVDDPGPTNVVDAVAANTPRARFVRFEQPVVDDTTGGNEQPIAHRKLNLQILLGPDDMTGFETLPLMRVRRSETTGKPEVDPGYFPPSVSTDAWAPLGLGVVRRIYDRVAARSESLEQMINERGIGFSSGEAGDLEKMLLMGALNEAIGPLTCDAFAMGVHPLECYRRLCQIIGRLQVLGEQKRLSDAPRYDHDDLARVYLWALRRIEGLLDDRRQEKFEQRYFVGEGPGLQVALATKWFDAGWQWFVGAKPLNFTTEKCAQLFSKGRIDWKLGSSEHVDFMYSKKARGVELSPVPDPPRLLPGKDTWVYYRVTRDTPAWTQLKALNNMAIRINQKLIRSVDELQGSRRLDAVVDGEFVSLEFAIFAVPKSAAG